ncbi:hypothetical protein LIER_05962 [Lithospermum erythrorhizon]|uniref:Uncharacterized protein n=1 Tax=Lithospermum erythrorhizon TaxID=34254 RepID=A0AAV3P2J4_LITER
MRSGVALADRVLSLCLPLTFLLLLPRMSKCPWLSEIAPSSGDDVHTEVVDTGEFSDSMITEVADADASGDEAQTEVVDVEESADCIAMEVAGAEFSWAELCSFVEDKSYEALLAEEDDIMASFEAFMRFNKLDLSTQCEGSKTVFSMARHVRDSQCGVVPLEVHARLLACFLSLLANFDPLSQIV